MQDCPSSAKELLPPVVWDCRVHKGMRRQGWRHPQGIPQPIFGLTSKRHRKTHPPTRHQPWAKGLKPEAPGRLEEFSHLWKSSKPSAEVPDQRNSKEPLEQIGACKATNSRNCAEMLKVTSQFPSKPQTSTTTSWGLVFGSQKDTIQTPNLRRFPTGCPD